MPYWRCEIPRCLSLSLLTDGDCFWCGKHLCAYHITDTSRHRCPTVDRATRYQILDEQYRLHNALILSSLDLLYAINLAESHRPGYTCSPPSREFSGVGYGRQFQLTIGWDDGSTWTIKIRPHRRQDPPPEACRMSVLSEMACMIALRKRGVAVPPVHYNPAVLVPNSGLPFFFVDTVHGVTYDPSSSTCIPPQPSDFVPKMIRGMRQYYLSLEQATFDKFGSLTLDHTGKISIGPIAGRQIQFRTPPFYLGPFRTAKERYIEHFETMLDQLRRRERGLPSRAPFDYLVALEMRSLIAGSRDMDGPGYVKHEHDRAEHYRFNSSGEVIGVTNWEWSYITCKAEAFAAPTWFLPPSFESGSNALGPLELALMDAYAQVGRIDLARLVRGGKAFQRLSKMLSGQEIKVVHLNATRRAFLGETDGKQGEPKNEQDWAREVSKRFRNDTQLKAFVTSFL